VLALLRPDISDNASMVDARWENAAAFIEQKVSLPVPLGADIPIAIISARCAGGIGLPDYFKCGPLQLISPRLRAMFAQHSKDIDYLPAVITNGNGLSDHSVARVIRSIDCLDRDGTVGEKNGSHFFNITKLRLNERKTDGCQLFVVATAMYITCVGDALRADLLRIGFTGMRLISETEWK